MAESKGWAKALRRVTRGAAVSTSSVEFPLSNMRDCVATMGFDSTCARGRNEVAKAKLEIRPRHWATGRISSCEFLVLRLLLGGRGFRGGISVLLGKALDAAGGVHQFLLSGEKRMTVGANFDVQPVSLDGGTGLEIVSAGAVHRDGMVVGMNTGLHSSPIVRVRSARLALLSSGFVTTSRETLTEQVPQRRR
jgi:hypothetical protein